MGGTMRLGADPVKLHEGTQAREIFGEAVIYKRHRHRYEVNNQLRRRLEDEGLVCRRHLARRAPGRDGRASRPPVLRRLPVPPGVQLAPDPARAAVPRVRRRRGQAAAPQGAAMDSEHEEDETREADATARSRSAARPEQRARGCRRLPPVGGEAERMVRRDLRALERRRARLRSQPLLGPGIEIRSAMTNATYAGEEGLRRWVGEIDEQFSVWSLEVDAIRRAARRCLSLSKGHIQGEGPRQRRPVRAAGELAGGGAARDRCPRCRTSSGRSEAAAATGTRAMSASRSTTASSASARRRAPPAPSARSPTTCWPSCRARGRGRRGRHAAEPARAGAGNLIARVPGTRRRAGSRSSPTSTPCPHAGADRGRARRRRLPQRAATRSSAPTTRPRWRS